MLGDDPRQDLLHDVMPGPELFHRRIGEPNVSFAELLEPHLELVKTVAGGKRRPREAVVGVEVGGCLRCEGFRPSRHGLRRRGEDSVA